MHQPLDNRQKSNICLPGVLWASQTVVELLLQTHRHSAAGDLALINISHTPQSAPLMHFNNTPIKEPGTNP